MASTRGCENGMYQDGGLFSTESKGNKRGGAPFIELPYITSGDLLVQV